MSVPSLDWFRKLILITNKDTGDEQAITDAFAIMDAVIVNLTFNSGLRESCEATNTNSCDADQETFKGILTYYM